MSSKASDLQGDDKSQTQTQTQSQSQIPSQTTSQSQAPSQSGSKVTEKSSAANESSGFPSGGFEEDENAGEEAAQAVPSEARSRRTLPKSEKSFFDNGILMQRIEEGEEEEEESDYAKDQAYAPDKYDIARFGYDELKDEERQEIIARLKELGSEIRVLTVVNKFLFRNYINAMRNSASFATALDRFEDNLIYEDDRYLATLENFLQTRESTTENKSRLESELKSLTEELEHAKADQAVVTEALDTSLLTVAQKIAVRPGWYEEFERSLVVQGRRSADNSRLRLAYMKLRHKLDKLAFKLSGLDSLGAGYTVIGYELLLRTRDGCRDKSEEQLESLAKLFNRNLTAAGVIRHIDEECEVYNGKIQEEAANLEELAAENKAEYQRFVELVEERARTFKSIMKMRENIGLLDKPYLLRKMEADMKTIVKLKKSSQSLVNKMQIDRQRLLKV